MPVHGRMGYMFITEHCHPRKNYFEALPKVTDNFVPTIAIHTLLHRRKSLAKSFFTYRIHTLTRSVRGVLIVACSVVFRPPNPHPTERSPQGHTCLYRTPNARVIGISRKDGVSKYMLAVIVPHTSRHGRFYPYYGYYHHLHRHRHCHLGHIPQTLL